MISRAVLIIIAACFGPFLFTINCVCINKFQVQLIIETNPPETYWASQGENVIQLLEGLNHVLDTTNFPGLGLYVNAIDGVFANWEPDHQYWMLLINSKESDLGASNYVLKPNDVVTWKIVTFDPSQSH